MIKNIIEKFNIVDLIIVIAVIIALSVGFFTSKHFRQTADKQIEATSPITFQVFLRGVTVTGEEFPIKVNQKTFITIRNVPYTELNVLNVVHENRKIVIPSQNNNSYVIVKDPAQPSVYDAVVTISDVAKITKDGAVVDGNKIKMGLPVTLEGEKYKYNGIISDIRITTEEHIEQNADSLVG